ncbi:MAG: F0F1 ATP synthase subunit epsilon [Candidatus Marinimicrobia bacterium]|nr:F0F1 ATP synthase subunit epsilon [Candidatus Neomarinimicrobiota bacterium]MCF7841099.1 F0F1 ATP synthase subunit epsilon [Candidatus Neomarinimicrobiota bacterium]MCF7901878.1 F0F1 ATP synthase subunit epsilon [Candidatus Neomarinimicrobiota bacterium]
MANSFHLEIITPTRVFDEGQVTYLRAPSTNGLFGVLPGHVDAMIALDVGEIKIERSGMVKYMATSGGYAEIRADHVQLLVETAEAAEAIDVQRAQAALERAKQHLADKTSELEAEQQDLDAMERALNRMRIAERSKS